MPLSSVPLLSSTEPILPGMAVRRWEFTSFACPDCEEAGSHCAVVLCGYGWPKDMPEMEKSPLKSCELQNPFREVCENSVPQSSFSNSLVCTLISFSLSPPACLCRYSFTRDFLVPLVKPLPFLDLAVSTSHPCVQSALMQLRDGGKVSRDGPTGVMSTSNKDRG